MDDQELQRRCDAVLNLPLFDDCSGPTIEHTARVIARHGGSISGEELRRLHGLRPDRFAEVLCVIDGSVMLLELR